MEKDFQDHSVTGDVELIFPDDAAGQEYRLRERTVCDAEGVREREGLEEVPKFGEWIPVAVDGEEAWLNVPSALFSAVKEQVQTGQSFTVDRLEKSGHKQSARYEAEISVDSDETGQDRLATSDD